MTDRRPGIIDGFNALAIFHTMRYNLAMISSFMRISFLESSSYNSEVDVGFLEVEPGVDQVMVHNRAVMDIVSSLLYQTCQNYCVLKRIKPGLQDRVVERFLNEVEDRAKFIEGMKTIRNATFHIKKLRRVERERIVAFEEACMRAGGLPVVAQRMRELFYEYTEKCFRGELRILPDEAYEYIEKRKREDPDFANRWEKGEIMPEDL